MPECAIHPITYSEGILATVVKKSLAPPREYSGYEYELYHVRKQQNASNRRPVGLRPAGRFLSIFADCHFRQKIRWKRRRSADQGHFCKLVLYHEAVDYFRERKRQRGWETSFETLPLSELDTLCTIDQYPSDSFIFPAYGCELQISDGLVAAAFAPCSDRGGPRR